MRVYGASAVAGQPSRARISPRALPQGHGCIPAGCVTMFTFHRWLLLDSRIVDLLMAYNPTFVMLSFLKPLFFNSLKKESLNL